MLPQQAHGGELANLIVRPRIGLHVKYPILLPNFKGPRIFFIDFRKKKYTNVKFHENPSTIRIFMKYNTEQVMINTTLINVTATNSSDISEIHIT